MRRATPGATAPCAWQGGLNAQRAGRVTAEAAKAKAEAEYDRFGRCRTLRRAPSTSQPREEAGEEMTQAFTESVVEEAALVSSAHDPRQEPSRPFLCRFSSPTRRRCSPTPPSWKAWRAGEQTAGRGPLFPNWEHVIFEPVKIISRPFLRRLREREGCEDAKQPLLSWFKEVEKATWKNPAEVKKLYGSADLVGDGRIVFNIGGNKYRLVVWVKYSIELVLIQWVGTHEEYDAIDSQRGRRRRPGRSRS